jgi:hypothetical protein
MERGHSKEVIRWLNRVRIHLQVIFLLDVLTTSGNRIEASALRPQPNTDQRSVLNWPKEEPTLADMMLWKEALEDICPSRWRLNCLGLFAAKSHQMQDWRWFALSNELLRYHHDTNSMDVYKNTTKKLNRYTKSFSTPWAVRGMYAPWMKYSQESFASRLLHRRHKTQTNQRLLWRSYVSGDAPGYGSICPLKEEQTGSCKQSWRGLWWPSQTGHIHGSNICGHAQQPLSWSVPKAAVDSSAHSKRR